MDPVALEEAIIDRRSKGKQPKAIIVVHLYGMPAKMDDILDVAHKYDIPIIEDAAEALGSSYNGQKCGSFGNFGILSFNGNKIITTSGGGALLSNDEAMIQKARFLATQARDDAPHYQHSHIGYNYRMSNVIAGIGRGQMEVIEDRVKARRRVNDFYVKLFKDVEGIEVLREPNERFFSNMWLTTITIDSQITGFTREDLRLRLLEDNIESRPLWKPMHLQPVFNEYPYYGSNVAEKLFINGLCLPSGSNMSEQDLERIKHCIMQEINTHV
jgi:dTDP-4-amino-4,6-dideoxygalactose transaminase